MRTLLLLRHAKSDWEAPFGRDHDRPLNARGRRAAALIGETLARLELVPDRVLTSSALRAKTTVELAMAAGKWRSEVEVLPSFYDSSPAAVLAEIHRQPASAATLLVAGHQPVWSELASLLIGGGNLLLPTAGLVAIEFDVASWRLAAPGRGALAWFLVPRMLEKLGLGA